jgi:hypothetical protein
MRLPWGGGEKFDSITINLFESSDVFEYEPGLGNAKVGVYSNLKKISAVLDSSGQYVNLEYHETRKYSQPNSVFTQISTVYNRMENIPHEILNYLK